MSQQQSRSAAPGAQQDKGGQSAGRGRGTSRLVDSVGALVLLRCKCGARQGLGKHRLSSRPCHLKVFMPVGIDGASESQGWWATVFLPWC